MIEVGMGQLGLSPSSFYAMTLDELTLAIKGWNKREEIRERFEYSVAQLKELAKSDQRAYNNTCCGGETDAPAAVGSLASSCKGKVWSAKIHARKPA